MAGIEGFVSKQLATLASPPSELEFVATRDFFKTGLERNRFLALIKAVSAIATSGIMLIDNPVTGVTRGCALLVQCRVTEGVYTIGAGILNDTRSLYNIFRVFIFAIGGLLPVLNSILYQYGSQNFMPKPPAPPAPTPDPLQGQLDAATQQIGELREQITQLTQDHERALQQLNAQLAERTSAQSIDRTQNVSAADVQGLQVEHEQAMRALQTKNQQLVALLTSMGTALNLPNDLVQLATNPLQQKPVIDLLNKIPTNFARQKGTIEKLRAALKNAQIPDPTKKQNKQTQQTGEE